MAKNKLAALMCLSVAILILSSCTHDGSVVAPASKDPPVLTATSVLMASPTFVAANAPTHTITPQPTSPPILQVPLANPPSGLVYESNKVLSYIGQDGNPATLFEIPAEVSVGISANGKSGYFVSFGSEGGLTIKLVDFLTQSQIDINPGSGHFLCGLMQWPKREDIVLVYLEPREYSGGMYCNGVPAILSLETQKIDLLGSKPGPENSADISQDGESIAFGDDGEPWIYSFSGGSRKLEIQQYDFPIVANAYFSNPSWSPSGRYLAWVVNGQIEGKEQEGVGIFDMDTKTSQFFHPYQVRGFDIRSSVVWNPDEKIITLENRTLHTQWIINLDNGDPVTLEFIPVWDSTGSRYAHLEYDRSVKQGFIVINDITTGKIIKVTLPLEAEILEWLSDTQLDWGNNNILYLDENGEKLLWNSDGKSLIIKTGNNNPNHPLVEWNWILDMESLQLHRLDLPGFSKIYYFMTINQ